MKVLITGAMGLNLISRFAKEGYATIAFDIYRRKLDVIDDVKEGTKFYKGDVTDLDSIEDAIKSEQPTGIVHAAYNNAPVYQDSADLHQTFEESSYF